MPTDISKLKGHYRSLSEWRKQRQRDEDRAEIERERYREQIDRLVTHARATPEPQRVFIRHEYDHTTYRQLIHVAMRNADGGLIVLYHGPYPPKQSDILEHWSKMLGDALTGDGT